MTREVSDLTTLRKRSPRPITLSDYNDKKDRSFIVQCRVLMMLHLTSLICSSRYLRFCGRANRFHVPLLPYRP